MKINTEITINANRDQVWQVFDNPDNLPKWQPTLKRVVHQSGEPGQAGSVTQLNYEEDEGEIIFTQTITSRKEPEEMTATWSNSYGQNVMRNQFIQLAANQTRWIIESDISLSGMFKFLAPALEGLLKKRLEGNMHRFKALAEGLGHV